MLSLDQRSPHSTQSDQTSHSTITTIGYPGSLNQGLEVLFSQIRGDNVQTDYGGPEHYLQLCTFGLVSFNRTGTKRVSSTFKLFTVYFIHFCA